MNDTTTEPYTVVGSDYAGGWWVIRTLDDTNRPLTAPGGYAHASALAREWNDAAGPVTVTPGQLADYRRNVEIAVGHLARAFDAIRAPYEFDVEPATTLAGITADAQATLRDVITRIDRGDV